MDIRSARESPLSAATQFKTAFPQRPVKARGISADGRPVPVRMVPPAFGVQCCGHKPRLGTRGGPRATLRRSPHLSSRPSRRFASRSRRHLAPSLPLLPGGTWQQPFSASLCSSSARDVTGRRGRAPPAGLFLLLLLLPPAAMRGTPRPPVPAGAQRAAPAPQSRAEGNPTATAAAAAESQPRARPLLLLLLLPPPPPPPAGSSSAGPAAMPAPLLGGEAARLPAPPRSHGGSRTAEPWSRRRSWSCWDPTASSAPSSCSCCCWVPSPPFYSSAAGTAGCRRADTPSNPSSRAARGAEVRRRAAARRRRAEGPGLRQPRRRPSPCNAAGGREGARGRAAPGAPRNFAPNFSGCIKDKCRRAGGGEGGERRSECSPDLCFLTDAVMRTHHFRSEVIYLARNFKVRSCSLYLSTCPYCCPRPFFFCNEIA